MENWYKWRLGFTFKNEVTNFLIWYTKMLFNPLKHFQKIEVTDLQKLGYYWVFVLSINVNKSEIFKQNLFVWNPQVKIWGLIWYILWLVKILVQMRPLRRIKQTEEFQKAPGGGGMHFSDMTVFKDMKNFIFEIWR